MQKQNNMDNLFLTAMDANKVTAIEQTKANKAFALRIINDLRRVFQVNEQTSDTENSCVIRIKAKSNYIYQNNSFVANDKGVFFNFKSLGYYTVNTERNPRIMPLGKLYEKYKDTGSSAESRFLDPTSRHGYVAFRIELEVNDVLLNDKLRDIVYLLEQDGYNKVF